MKNERRRSLVVCLWSGRFPKIIRLQAIKSLFGGTQCSLIYHYLLMWSAFWELSNAYCSNQYRCASTHGMNPNPNNTENIHDDVTMLLSTVK